MAVFAALAGAAVNADFDRGGQGVKAAARPEAALSQEVPSAKAQPAVLEEKQPRAAADWTLMVFMNGKNNLEPYAFKNFYQMERVGSSDKLNIVVEFGRMAKHSSNDGGWKGCRRYLVQKADDSNAISSPAVETYPQCDMGDYNRAIDFGKWAMQKYPARHYMYIIWNHGSGWTRAGKPEVIKAISSDDETRHRINTPQMGDILKALGHIDVYGSDACLMQMAEVAYQIKDYTSFIVGSEENEAGDGYTYDKFLNAALASGMSPEDVAKAAVETYTEHYGSGATQSYVRSAALKGLPGKLDAFADAVMLGGDKAAVQKARADAQHFAVEYNYRDNADLGHFVSLVINSPGCREDVKAAGGALLDYLNREVVGLSRVTDDYSNATGLAIYLPAQGYNMTYDELAFAKSGKWPQFVKWLLN